MLKLGFHCLGLLKQRWTPSQFYTKHCLLSPQRSLSRDLSQTVTFTPPLGLHCLRARTSSLFFSA